MKFSFNAFFLILIILLYSCDKFYKVYLDKEINKEVNFQCGKINMKCLSIEKRGFLVDQNYTVNNQLTLNKDSLKVLYMNNIIPFTLALNTINIERSSLICNSDFNLKLRFYIPGGIKTGDTIIIQLKGFLYCLNKAVKSKSIKLYIAE